MKKEKVFEIRAINNLTKDEFIQFAIDDWRNYVMKIIEEVDTVEFEQIKLLSYFSIMESIAQDIANYPLHDQQHAFKDFVLKYQKGYDFLEYVDPITLFYHCEEDIKEEITLECLDDETIYYFDDEKIRDVNDKIYSILVRLKGEQSTNKIIEKHRFVSLLYRIRCQVSHEFSNAYTTKRSDTKPYYYSCSRYYLLNDKVVNDDVWKLRIPVNLVKELCLNCIENYLDECQKNGRIPLENNGLSRKCLLSWHIK